MGPGTRRGGAAVAIGLITIAAVVSADRQLRGAVDEDLRHRATQLARWSGTLDNTNRFERRTHPARDRGLRRSGPGLRQQRSRAAAHRTGGGGTSGRPVDLEVLNRNGHRLIRGVEVGGTPYRMITVPIELPLGDGGSPLGFQIAIDHSRVEANLAALTRQLVLIGVIGVMLVGFTGWLLASRAVQPITDLTDTAERIASTERLDAAGQLDISAPAEIGRLAGAFSLDARRAINLKAGTAAAGIRCGSRVPHPDTALTTNLELLRRQRDRISGEQRG